MCQTEGMRTLLVLLTCAVGFAQLPGTPDPAKAKQPDPPKQAPGVVDSSKLDTSDAVIRTQVNVVIAPFNLNVTSQF